MKELKTGTYYYYPLFTNDLAFIGWTYFKCLHSYKTEYSILILENHISLESGCEIPYLESKQLCYDKNIFLNKIREIGFLESKICIIPKRHNCNLLQLSSESKAKALKNFKNKRDEYIKYSEKVMSRYCSIYENNFIYKIKSIWNNVKDNFKFFCLTGVYLRSNSRLNKFLRKKYIWNIITNTRC